ncbi:FadR/GntR family transcriptional regulator [[Mycobacterium] vasticus]|uniref:FCD domain-containing protein n=1 Tax=[Mycobacterium] vasticus TaxID=2875777 RepID=A0ABU5YYR0_9MYCO|nr:FCD domain-containing protein [Mycolicibacter sp. MYC017]MEB3070285.1 FCD domain-containing protein [Mycolicibacter sp. MYC017]
MAVEAGSGAIARRFRTDPHASGKRGQITARAIADEIVRRGWVVGESLGSEGELLERFDVSRAVLREAIRLLEHQGVARMGKGPSGGLVVTAPDATAVVESAALYCEFRRVDISQLYESRSALELTCVEIVARQITETNIAALRAALDEDQGGGDAKRLAVSGHDLHVLIAQLTGNPTLELFVSSLVDLTARYTADLPNSDCVSPISRTAADDMDAAAHAHRGIVEAIVAGDAALARHRMDRHLAAMAQWLTDLSTPSE